MNDRVLKLANKFMKIAQEGDVIQEGDEGGDVISHANKLMSMMREISDKLPSQSDRVGLAELIGMAIDLGKMERDNSKKSSVTNNLKKIAQEVAVNNLSRQRKM